MKTSFRKYVYIIYFFVLASVFALLYYGGYYYARNNMKSDNIISKEKIEESNPFIKFQSETDDASEVNSNIDEIVTSKTNYIEETYNIDTKEITKETKKIPIELLGLNRTGVIDYLSTYKSNEKNDAIKNIQLVSFSKNEIVIRKSIREITKNYYYYVITENDIIVIYKADKTTKYFDTGINIENFDAAHKAELKKGFYIETIHDLYNYLEGITS